jgi:hypothetical protein
MIPTEGPLYRLFRRFAGKKFHYCVTFSKENDTNPMLRAGSAQAVLRDLAWFCHADSPCEDQRSTGRRDVWLRLVRFLRLNEEELAILYAGLSPEDRYQIYKPGSTFVDDEE